MATAQFDIFRAVYASLSRSKALTPLASVEFRLERTGDHLALIQTSITD
jgi:hypothetical protein